MALHRSSELKKRAWLAKQRLKMGYWESVKREKAQITVPTANSESVSLSYARVRYMRDPDGDMTAVRDEKLYKKVCAILDRDETTINPIGQLIDAEVYDSLDPASKQRYILELSNKFRELKERYYKERSSV